MLILFLFSCKPGQAYHDQASKECNNLKFNVGRLYPKEVIELYYNHELILRYKVDSLDGYRFEREFCLDYKKEGILQIVSSYKNKKYLDTSVKVVKKDFGYFLSVSYPLPKDWKNYFKKGIAGPIKEWGYQPIEKSVRLISLRPDTIYRNTWVDDVH
jgi:hypothetical protein